MTDEKLPLIVVDAANVVGSRPDGWWRDRVGAAQRLLTGLTGLTTASPDLVQLVLVLEGAARVAAEPGVIDGVRVVHASGSGDDEIVAVVASAEKADPSRAITVVTADRGLRERVESYGATTVGPSWLWGRLDAQ
jgi:hypothetical protein